MTPVQVRAAHRAQLALLKQCREKARDQQQNLASAEAWWPRSGPPNGGWVFSCSSLRVYMAISYDFQIIGRTDVPGISLVVAQNEDAFTYLTEEVEMTILPNGCSPLATDKVGDFISDCGWAHMACDYVWSTSSAPMRALLFSLFFIIKTWLRQFLMASLKISCVS